MKTEELNKTEQSVDAEETTKEEEVVKMTKEELNALLQKEGDKRVSSAQSRWEQRANERVSEAEKLAKMDEESRKQYEFEQRVKDLEQREKELTLSANKVECLKIMSNKGLPQELVDFVVHEDADTMNERINLFENIIKKEVSARVMDKIGVDSPKAGANSEGPITRESFQKMSLAEQMDIYNSNPDLYEKLTGK